LPLLLAQAAQCFPLQILHLSDQEGAAESLDAMHRLAALVAYFENAGGEEENTIIISSGDIIIPGASYNAGGEARVQTAVREALGDEHLVTSTYPGRPAIAIPNILGVQITTLGNHDFDPGTSELKGLIGPAVSSGNVVQWTGTAFPWVSANLDFSKDSNMNPLYTDEILDVAEFKPPTDDPAVVKAAKKLARAAVIQAAGETIGFVGATTPMLESISRPQPTTVKNPGAGANDMDALAGILQPVIDELTAMGIDKIILLAHMQQIQYEEELIAKLHDVDIVLAGGSDSILADDEDIARGLRSGDEDKVYKSYPILTQNADGDPAVVINTDGQYKYLGRLVVEFDELTGLIMPESIDENVSGAFASTETQVAALWGVAGNAYTEGSRASRVKTITDAVKAVVLEKDSAVHGKTQVYLNGERSSVRTEETNLGDLTCEAYMAQVNKLVDAADPVDVALTNGGGIRASIGEIVAVPGSTGEYQALPPQANPVTGRQEGEISRLAIETSFKFANKISVVNLTAENLKAILEHGVSASCAACTPGQYPQVAGMAFSFDVTKPAGQRIWNLAILETDAKGSPTGTIKDVVVQDGQLQGNPARVFRMATLDFLANGGDSYPFAALATDRVDYDLDYTDAFQNHMDEHYPAAGAGYNQADAPATEEARAINLGRRGDVLQASQRTAPEASEEILLSLKGSYMAADPDARASEIVAYDSRNEQLFVTNSATGKVDVLDAANPSNLTLKKQIDLSAYGTPTSVAVKNDMLAVAVPNPNPQSAGWVLLYDTQGAFKQAVAAGALPDMVTFTPDGKYLLAANEGEPDDSYGVDPEGSITIIDVSAGLTGASTAVNAGFQAFNNQKDALVAAGVRIFGNNGLATVAQDLEPEYLAVTPDSATAFCSLQENNAIAVIDIASKTVTAILPLGYKDYSLAGNSLDASDRDGGIHFANYAGLLGMHQPDAIACYRVNGKTYIVTANEGDARDYDGFSEDARVKDLDLDPAAFPYAADLQKNEVLGRLKTTTATGDADGDGDFDKIYAYGGRSFSIYEYASGALTQVFDSGDQFERLAAEYEPDFFNQDEGEFDARSDDKGGEPEALALGEIGGRWFAFIGEERQSAILGYDITDPEEPEFVQYLSAETHAGSVDEGAAGNVSPEGLVFIPSAAMGTTGDRSPDYPHLAVAFETSGSTAMWEIRGEVVPEPVMEEEDDGDDNGCVLNPLAGLSLEWHLLLLGLGGWWLRRRQ